MSKIFKNVCVLAICMFCSQFTYAQREVGGVKVPETKTYEGQDLNLNGAGIREKWFMDLYVGSLYLQKQSADEEAIIMADELQAIHLDITSGMITSEKMENAVRDGFDKATKGNTKPIDDKIERFIGVFHEEIQKGDQFDFVNTPSGVKIYKNNELKSTIAGKDFKEALFGIWLSEDPADKGLKADMLGK